MLRRIGNPLPLGFLALAGTTLLVSGLQLGGLNAGRRGVGADVAHDPRIRPQL
jgi:hypothetical protein